MIPMRVCLYDALVGHLSIRVGGAATFPEDWSFQYATDSLADRRVPLSVSLPIRAAAHEGAVVYNWYANLLPEGVVRDAIAQRLRLPPRDNFQLLASIGGECAGAVSITAASASIPGQMIEANSVPLEAALADLGVAQWALLGGPVRLSLAGAQDKIAVVREGAAMRLPKIGEPSTHIVKPESTRLRGLCDLELLGMSLAAAMSLPVAKAELVSLAGTRALVVERYDRIRRDGRIVCLHQEDFCQALGLPPEFKYQSMGGPSLADCANLIRRELLGPVALQAYLDWVIFAVLIGNADAHAKNLSLLRTQDGRLGLAPFYDLVPTVARPQSLLDRKPALSIGGADRIDKVDGAHWDAFALASGFRPVFVRKRVRALASAMGEALPGAVSQVVATGADQALMASVLKVLGENAARHR